MIYLTEMRPVRESTGEEVVLRFGSSPYTTEPRDTPANAEFEDRVEDPGNYERFLFSRGRTRGESTVGGGDIVLSNPDRELDWLLDLAFDGRQVTIWGLESPDSPWSSREVILVGTMEQATFPGRQVEVRIRDRLYLLRDSLQKTKFKGTTTSGAANDAEGNVDLKDVYVPELYGWGYTITPIAADPFNDIYRVARRLDGVTAVRDTGVALPPMTPTDYPDLAALKAVDVPEGKYATCLALGMVKTGFEPDSLTVDCYEGATAEERSAARIARRMVPAGVPVLESSFEVLQGLNPAECGLYTGTSELEALSAMVRILSSVGASVSADRLGNISVERLELPSGEPVAEIDESVILSRSEGLARLAPSDDGEGIPTPSVTVRWGRASTVYSESDLKDVASSDEFRSFATQEWRLEEVKSATNEERHPKAPKLSFDTCLVRREDALAEATRLMQIYGRRRDIFNVELPSDEAEGIDLGDLVLMRVGRFGMENGALLRVMGIVVTYATNITELELWR